MLGRILSVGCLAVIGELRLISQGVAKEKPRVGTQSVSLSADQNHGWSGSRVGLVLVGACALLSTNCVSSKPHDAETKGQGMKSGSPTRIISLSPNVTEILHGVDAFGRVIAVSDYCSYPAAVNQLPRVGGWQNSDDRPDAVAQ